MSSSNWNVMMWLTALEIAAVKNPDDKNWCVCEDRNGPLRAIFSLHLASLHLEAPTDIVTKGERTHQGCSSAMMQTVMPISRTVTEISVLRHIKTWVTAGDISNRTHTSIVFAR